MILNNIPLQNNQLLKTKLEFFCNYFDYTIYQIGAQPEFELENHYTLSEKLVFHMNRELKFSAKYIVDYLEHPLFEIDNPFFLEYSSHAELIPLLQDLNQQLQKNRAKWVKINLLNLKRTLRNLRYESKSNLVSLNINKLLEILKSKFDLNHHKVEICSRIRFIIVTLLVSDKTKNDLIRLTDQLFSQRGQKYIFPKVFLKTLMDLSNKDKELAKNKFLTNLTLQDRFESIVNYHKDRKEYKFFAFRINNLKPEKNLKVRYDNVTFYDKNHSKFHKIKEQHEKNNKNPSYFQNDAKVLAVVRINLSSMHLSSIKAHESVSKALLALNRICDTRAFPDRYSYLYTKDFTSAGYFISSRDNVNHITAKDVKRIHHGNPFLFLRKSRSITKAPLLKHEHILNRALSGNRISDYWIYLETLIGGGFKVISDIVATRASYSTSEYVKNNTLKTIFNIFEPFNGNAVSLGIDSELYFENHKYLYQEELRSISLPHPVNCLFTSDLIDEYNQSNDNSIEKGSVDYYKRILMELYSYRNAELHSGEIEICTLIKLSEAIPRVVMLFRWCLFLEIERNPDKSFHELLKFGVNKNMENKA